LKAPIASPLDLAREQARRPRPRQLDVWVSPADASAARSA